MDRGVGAEEQRHRSISWSRLGTRHETQHDMIAGVDGQMSDVGLELCRRDMTATLTTKH